MLDLLLKIRLLYNYNTQRSYCCLKNLLMRFSFNRASQCFWCRPQYVQSGKKIQYKTILAIQRRYILLESQRISMILNKLPMMPIVSFYYSADLILLSSSVSILCLCVLRFEMDTDWHCKKVIFHQPPIMKRFWFQMKGTYGQINAFYSCGLAKVL